LELYELLNFVDEGDIKVFKLVANWDQILHLFTAVKLRGGKGPAKCLREFLMPDLGPNGSTSDKLFIEGFAVA